MITDRVRTATPYPLTPDGLVGSLAQLVQPLGPFTRVSVGFPGVVRDGRVLTAPHFVRRTGPEAAVDRKLQNAWADAPLRDALAAAFGVPVRLANDADVQGAAVVSGTGLEMVVTLGTSVGTALFDNGRVAPHLELGHHPLHKDQTYDDRLGEAARKAVGARRWQARVRRAITVLDALVNFDRLYIGGGNGVRLKGALPDRVVVVSNDAGILGGHLLWDRRRFPDLT